jgi:hypothetical protein
MSKRLMEKNKKGKFVWSLLLLAVTGFFVSVFLPNQFVVQESFADQAQLSDSDCGKCHASVQSTVDSMGGKHKTAISCMGCHKGHPPMVSKDKIIPVCSDCHAGKPHYEIGGCNTCHTDPHAPLQMKLAVNLTAPCLSCHPKQGEELKDNPTLHSKLFCTTCHKEHKDIPSCLKCHQPHAAEQTDKDCAVCHPAHQPLTITFAPDMPNSQCAACHADVSNALTSSNTKHSQLACVFCHKEKHKYVPACEMCHGTPHPAGMLKQFPQCNMCHLSAHSLGKEVGK